VDWDAEVTVDEARARELIAEQCFTPRTLRLLGEGWDNTVWLVDERWVFRFPRRAFALPGVEREIAVLGALAEQLPLPVPVPRWVGASPWPFFGAELIRGSELADARLTEDDRCALGRPLGEFLRALHDARVEVDLPEDPNARADMAKRAAMAETALERLGIAPPRELLAACRELPPSAATGVAHGDLHIRHLLVDRGRAAGVIDWGDVCRADPAIDMPLLWCALPPDGRDEFFAAYGPIDEAQALRSRLLAVFLCAVLADYGRATGRESLVDGALDGLKRALRAR
jgi:aminoglycoside phosphotransferase (APT) family kinase protein